MSNRDTKEEALEKIAQEIKKCKECRQGKSGKAVAGEGNEAAKVVFIGEAPGREEAKTGRPFVGRSGQFLRSQIKKLGFDDEEDVYITSPVKYLPDRGTPNKRDIEHGRTHLMKQLEIIDPKVIVLLGSIASQGVLNEKISVQKEHGKTIKTGGKIYFLTYHPAAAVRFPPVRFAFIKDFQKLKSLVRRLKII